MHDLKMQDLKMQDLKMTDQLARRENARHEMQARTLLHVRCAFFNGDLESH